MQAKSIKVKNKAEEVKNKTIIWKISFEEENGIKVRIIKEVEENIGRDVASKT